MAKRLFELNMSACLMPSDLAARRRPLLAQSGHRRVRERTLVMIPGDHLCRLGCDAKDNHERLAA